MRQRGTAILVCFLALASIATACNVPVFRYALERWQNDLYHVVVFHKGDLSADDRKRVDDIGRRSTTEGGTTNLEVTAVDVTKPFEPGFEDLWKTVPADSQAPFVLVQARMGREKTLTVWQGPLAKIEIDKLAYSPDREEIVARLLKGHSAVWVVLPGKDEVATHNTINLIETELNRLQDELPLPPGIGAPGSEVYSEVPLTLRFSVHVLKPGPEADVLLPEILRRVAPDAAAAGQPLVVPVFGRGRAVDVIPGDKVDEATVEDLSRFICGACSCQVKEQNPGFDLLMSVQWDERLFAPDVKPPADVPKKQLAAELVPIASGSKVLSDKLPNTASAIPVAKSTEAVAPAASKSETGPVGPDVSATEYSWKRAWLIAFVGVALLMGWALRSGRG